MGKKSNYQKTLLSAEMKKKDILNLSLLLLLPYYPLYYILFSKKYLLFNESTDFSFDIFFVYLTANVHGLCKEL